MHFQKRSKSPEEANVGKCASTRQKEATLKNTALKSGSIHHPCCLSDLEKTMKLMSCIKDHWERGMITLEGRKVKDKMTTRWLLNDVLLCADLLKCHCQVRHKFCFNLYHHEVFLHVSSFFFFPHVASLYRADCFAMM